MLSEVSMRNWRSLMNKPEPHEEVIVPKEKRGDWFKHRIYINETLYLTRKEAMCYWLLSNGYTPLQIQLEGNIGSHDTNNYLRKVVKRFGVTTREEVLELLKQCNFKEKYQEHKEKHGL